jgi:2-(1,2-epoxy-1,2-dihydrophenyl)acetyl-CoA isomerase
VTDSVLYDVANAVATVTLNRPAARNALDLDLKVALRDTLRSAAEDPAVRAVVLTGAGPAFCVGQDLGDHAANLEANAPAAWTTVAEHYNPIALTLATMAKPVVAAVNGAAAGAGASFAFACDFRVVARSAGFNLAFAAVGLGTDSGASWTLPRLVGWAKATELLMLPSTIRAEQALSLGLASSVVDDGTVLEEALALARRLAGGPTVAYAAIRRTLVYSAAHSLEESLTFEAAEQARAGTTDDHLNATRSFLRKEKPAFTGR